jgi:high-affinity nickel permease
MKFKPYFYLNICITEMSVFVILKIGKLKLETKNKMQLLDGKKTAETLKAKCSQSTKDENNESPHLAQ